MNDIGSIQNVKMCKFHEDAAASGYLLNLNSDYAVVTFRRNTVVKGRKTLLLNDFQVIIDLESLRDFEIMIEMDDIKSYRRMLSGMMRKREAESFLKRIVEDDSCRSYLLALLDGNNLLREEAKTFKKNLIEYINIDGSYRVRLFQDTYRKFQVVCEERCPNNRRWITDFTKKLEYAAEDAICSTAAVKKSFIEFHKMVVKLAGEDDTLKFCNL